MFNSLGPQDIITVLIIMLVSVSLHEAMHAFMAHALGDSTAKDEGRLTLNPFKHIDFLTTVLLPVVLIALGLPPIFIAKPVPFDPSRVRYGEFGAALVALAGPFTNLVFATLMSLLLRLFGFDFGIGFAETLVLAVQINVALFVFNMLPIPPLDGSRLLYAFAPEPVQRIMSMIESMGLIFVIVLFLLLSQFILPIVGNITEAIVHFLL